MKLLCRKRKKIGNMRVKIIVVLSILCSALITALAFGFDNVAYASDKADMEEVEEQLKSAVGEAIDTIDLSALEEYLDSMSSTARQATFINNLKNTLKALVNGESKTFYQEFANLVAKSAGEYFLGFIPSFVTVIIICILNGILSGMSADFASKSTSEVAHIMCYCAVIIVIMSGILSIVKTVSDTMKALTGFANAIFPVLLTLLSMLGGASVVATYSPLMAILCGFIMKLISSAVLPAFVATIIFSIVGNISQTVKLDKLTKLVKSASTWLIGIVFGIFASFLTAQGITGGVADKFGFNIAKFALSSYVPILGGYLSDGIDLLSASLVLVKNALGYTGVLILMGTVLFPILKIITFSLAMRLTSAVAEPIGDGRASALLHSVAGSLNLLITALAGVAFMFFLLIMLLIGSCNMGI